MDEVINTMAQETKDAQTAAEWLSEQTGRPIEEFEPPEDIEYPNLGDLESVPPEEVYGEE